MIIINHKLFMFYFVLCYCLILKIGKMNILLFIRQTNGDYLCSWNLRANLKDKDKKATINFFCNDLKTLYNIL